MDVCTGVDAWRGCYYTTGPCGGDGREDFHWTHASGDKGEYDGQVDRRRPNEQSLADVSLYTARYRNQNVYPLQSYTIRWSQPGPNPTSPSANGQSIDKTVRTRSTDCRSAEWRSPPPCFQRKDSPRKPKRPGPRGSREASRSSRKWPTRGENGQLSAAEGIATGRSRREVGAIMANRLQSGVLDQPHRWCGIGDPLGPRDVS